MDYVRIPNAYILETNALDYPLLCANIRDLQEFEVYYFINGVAFGQYQNRTYFFVESSMFSNFQFKEIEALCKLNWYLERNCSFNEEINSFSLQSYLSALKQIS